MAMAHMSGGETSNSQYKMSCFHASMHAFIFTWPSKLSRV